MSAQFLWLVVVVLAIEILLFWRVVHVATKKLEASDQDREDAEKWRNGQKPIGKLVDLKSNEKGLMITGEILDPQLAKAIKGSVGGYSISADAGEVTIPPKPEWETKKTFFAINEADILNMSVEEWQSFIQKVQQTWIEMLRNDGYKIGDILSSTITDANNFFVTLKKVEFSVKVHKEET